ACSRPRPGGRRQGNRPTHVALHHPPRPLRQGLTKLVKNGWKLNLQSAHQPGQNRRPNGSNAKFTCGKCGRNAWGKPDLAIVCKPCRVDMEAAGTSAPIVQSCGVTRSIMTVNLNSRVTRNPIRTTSIVS